MPQRSSVASNHEQSKPQLSRGALGHQATGHAEVQRRCSLPNFVEERWRCERRYEERLASVGLTFSWTAGETARAPPTRCLQ